MRGKKFRSAHVHSILKKRLAKEELLKLEYPPVWSDFSMEVVDKTILMSDFGFLKDEKTINSRILPKNTELSLVCYYQFIF